MAYLELQNLHRDFGTVKALDGIEIALGEGEFLSLLGPSGCGKTTALRLVAGFDRPDAGAIVVDGKDVTNVAPTAMMAMKLVSLASCVRLRALRNLFFSTTTRWVSPVEVLWNSTMRTLPPKPASTPPSRMTTRISPISWMPTSERIREFMPAGDHAGKE